MSANPAELSVETLERFRVSLRRAEAPLGQAIEPGLTSAELDELEAELSVRLPRELRTLWSWGRPSSATVDRNLGGWDINPSFQLWPPDQAIAATRDFRSLTPELTEYVAFAGPSQDDCLMVAGDEAGATNSLILAFTEDPYPLELTPSLGALFQLWADQLESGEYRFSFSANRWESIDGPLPFILKEE